MSKYIFLINIKNLIQQFMFSGISQIYIFLQLSIIHKLNDYTICNENMYRSKGE